MKRNFIKAIVAIFLLIITLTMTLLPATASEYCGSTTVYSGFWLWKKEIGEYRCYMDYHNCMVFQEHKLSRVAHHSERVSSTPYAALTISSEEGFTKSYSLTLAWNEALGLTCGSEDSIGLTASAGYGTEFGLGFDISKSNTITYTVMSNDPSGYYFIAPGCEIYVCHDEYYEWNNSHTYLIDQHESYTYYMPDGDGYAALWYYESPSSPIYCAG